MEHENTYDIDYDINLMIKINKILHSLPFLLEKSKEKKEKCEKMKSLVNEYLKEYCKHSIIDDFIDIDPDRSKYIRYCEKCELTFQVKKINN